MKILLVSPAHLLPPPPPLPPPPSSIYTIHDDVKDKQFDLFMTWVGDETGGKHEFVPEELVAEAKEYAEKALESDDEDEDEDED